MLTTKAKVTARVPGTLRAATLEGFDATAQEMVDFLARRGFTEVVTRREAAETPPHRPHLTPTGDFGSLVTAEGELWFALGT